MIDNSTIIINWQMSRYNNYFQSLEEENEDVTNGWDYEEEEEEYDQEYAYYDAFEYTRPQNPAYQFESEQIRIGLEQNTTVKELKLTNFTPELIKATAEGLRDSNTVETVIMEQNIYGYSTITQDALPYLRQILSIPRIRFKIIRKNDAMILEAIRGDSAKFITDLTVTTNPAQLNELLNEFRNNNVIEYIYIDRVSLESTCNSISVFGSFKLLRQLRIRIRGDECEQFFKAIRHGISLNHLDISNSIIPSEQAQHLADLIAANNCSIKYLDLSDCAIDDKALSIICNGLVRNKRIDTLCLKDNPFERLDLPSGLTSLPKKKLQHMTTHVFDENMDRIFYVDRLYITGDHFDGLKTARINRLAIERLHKIQQVTNLFDSFKNNNNIKSLRLLHIDGYDTIMEVCNRLKGDRVLRSVDTGFMPFSESSLKLFCQAIIENDTLESLTHSGDFHAESDGTGDSRHGDTDVLEALKKNKSLTKVDFMRLDCKDREIEQVLSANPFITFVRLDDRSRRSRVTELNDRNKRNIAKRISDIKLNIISLARSGWSRKLPIELWQLIMEFLRGLDVDYFELFQSNLKLK